MDTKEKNNAFKTSLLFLGIIFIVIILRAFLVSDDLVLQKSSSSQTAGIGCLGFSDEC